MIYYYGGAIILALAIALSEILTRYEKPLSEHIRVPGLFVYLVLNAFLTAIVYRALPDVAAFLLYERVAPALQSDSMPRVLTAGLGYAFLLRSKFAVIKICNRDLPIGGDLVHQEISNYLLRSTDAAIENEKFLQAAYEQFQDINLYLRALNSIIVSQVPDVHERNRLRNRREMITISQYDNRAKCTALAQILLDQVGGEKEVISLLKAASEDDLDAAMIRAEDEINTAVLGDLLTAAFSDEELTNFCFYYFRSVYESFAGGMSRPEKIRRLIERCERQLEIPELLYRVEAENPAQYAKFQGRLRS
jgi:hypothetical protein